MFFNINFKKHFPLKNRGLGLIKLDALDIKNQTELHLLGQDGVILHTGGMSKHLSISEVFPAVSVSSAAGFWIPTSSAAVKGS